MTTYSYAQLEGLWIKAGGPKSLAPLMAAIAEAESGGNSNAYNASGATGLWQILGAVNPADQPNLRDPAVNAREAVLKYKSQGLDAWTTYTSGAYKAFLNGSTTPDTNVPGGGASATLTAADPSCLFQISIPGGTAGGWISGALGAAGGAGAGGLAKPAAGVGSGVCIISRPAARAIAGGMVLVGGAVIGLLGVLILAAQGLGKSGALGKAADVAALVPGGELVAAGLHGANQRTQRTGSQAAARRQARNKPGRVLSHDEMTPEQLAETRSRQKTKVVAGPNATASDRKMAARSARDRGEAPPF
jgi:hypothetical protein